MMKETQKSVKLLELKSVLRTYNRMDHKTRRVFHELGFEIHTTEKHYKITYPGSPIVAIIGKTPSCNRAGKNVFRYCKQQYEQAV